jgi:hypothetical protein
VFASPRCHLQPPPSPRSHCVNPILIVSAFILDVRDSESVRDISVIAAALLAALDTRQRVQHHVHMEGEEGGRTKPEDDRDEVRDCKWINAQREKRSYMSVSHQSRAVSHARCGDRRPSCSIALSIPFTDAFSQQRGAAASTRAIEAYTCSACEACVRTANVKVESPCSTQKGATVSSEQGEGKMSVSDPMRTDQMMSFLPVQNASEAQRVLRVVLSSLLPHSRARTDKSWTARVSVGSIARIGPPSIGGSSASAARRRRESRGSTCSCGTRHSSTPTAWRGGEVQGKERGTPSACEHRYACSCSLPSMIRARCVPLKATACVRTPYRAVMVHS